MLQLCKTSLCGSVNSDKRGPEDSSSLYLVVSPIEMSGAASLPFFEAKNSPVPSPFQLEVVCYVCVFCVRRLALFVCGFLRVSVAVLPCVIVFKRTSHQ